MCGTRQKEPPAPPSPPPRLLLLSKMWLLNHYIFPSQYASGSCAMAIPSNM